MNLPESLYFLRPGWWALHIVAIAAVAGGAVHVRGHLAAHGAHGHDLKPVMHAMLVSMTAAQSALDRGDAAAARAPAAALASACDGAGHASEPALHGDRFADIDRELHARAAELSSVADAGKTDAAKAKYNATVAACVACHQQAPQAKHVDLGRLATPYPAP